MQEQLKQMQQTLQQQQQQMQQLQEMQEQMREQLKQMQEHMQQGWQCVASLQDQIKQYEEQQGRLQYKIDEVQSHHRNTRLDLLAKQRYQEETAAAAEERLDIMFQQAWTAAFESAAAADVRIMHLATQVAAAAHNQTADRAAILQLQKRVLNCQQLLEAAAAAAAAEISGSSSGISSSRSLVPLSNPRHGLCVLQRRRRNLVGMEQPLWTSGGKAILEAEVVGMHQ